MGHACPKVSKLPNRNFTKMRCLFKNDLGLFLDYLEYPGLSKDKINGVGAQGHVRKSRNHRNGRFEGAHISKSESYKFEWKRNNTTELLSISFP